MNVIFRFQCVLQFLCFSVCIAATNVSAMEDTLTEAQREKAQAQHNKWLQDRFGEQHQALIPVVAVADMYFACSLKNTEHSSKYSIKQLVTEMDRDELAERLTACLAGASLKSDQAINYGLIGCFHEQVASLPATERKIKMDLVKKAIASLSSAQRQESLTHCVTDQAISYLK